MHTTDVPVPSAQRPKVRRLRMMRAVSALILREMASRYGRSPGGYIWAFVEPVAGIALISAVFWIVLRSPPLGTNFAYFYASGFLPFFMFTGLSMQIATAIGYSRALLNYPIMSFMDAIIARVLLNGVTSLLVMTVLIVWICWYFNLSPIINWPDMFLAVAMLFSITTAVGTINCFLFNMYPIWQNIWVVITRPLFILSGVIFIPENVPLQWRDEFLYNPLAHVISQFRKGLYAIYDAPYVSPLYVFTISMALGFFGILLLLRNYKDIMLK